jgi:hypothetical protein
MPGAGSSTSSTWPPTDSPGWAARLAAGGTQLRESQLDRRTGTGPGTAQFYKKQAARLLRNFRPAALPARFNEAKLAAIVREAVGSSAETFDGTFLTESCLRRGNLMVNALRRSLPSVPTGSANMVDDELDVVAAHSGGLIKHTVTSG